MVVKSGPHARIEARMLAQLKAQGASVPEVLGLAPNLLFLEALSEDRPGEGSWRFAADTLRELHDAPAPNTLYGWDEDYAFGALAIENTQSENWVEFWGQHRILAPAKGLPPGIGPRLARLVEGLGDLLPATPRPSLLHGDLWAGNIVFGAAPQVWLIDPACYIGHSEVDLAMLNLFGSPGPEFDKRYGALEAGWQERRAVYTLWPALVHFRLFGSNYRGLVERLLSELGV